MRLDQYLTINGYFESRNKAASSVKEGNFTVNGKVVLKPSFPVSDGDVVEQQRSEPVYVARSARKLVHAFSVFGLAWNGKIAADFGASTGGFCQVLLENGVKKIYAVDIGTGQLHPKLKKDGRIVGMEQTNARYLSAASFPEPIEAVTADLSFISIKAVLPAVYQTLIPFGQAVVLIKPQFEAGRQHLNKNGVVTDRRVHCRTVEEIAGFAESCGFGVRGIAFSGLAGESGNREYLLFLEKNTPSIVSICNAACAAVYEEVQDG